jgi:glucokinase
LNEDYIIGVDLGGTKILTGLADAEGNILSEVKKPTGEKKGKEAVIKRIKETIYKVVEKQAIDLTQVQGIGLGSPGPLNIKEGIIYHTPNLNLDEVRIVEEMSDLEVPIFLENDANAAALGEKYFGAGKEVSNLIYVTVSTGIGGGIIIDGEVYHGVSDGAGEVGHLTLIPDSDIQCGCGNYGCWEAVASGTALARLGKEALEAGKDTSIAELVDKIDDVDGAVVAEAAEKEDQVAQQLMEQIAKYLGIGFASLINIFNPGQIIVGGGVSKSWDLIEETVEETIQVRAMDSLRAEVEVVTSNLGDKVGLKGAVAVALQRLGLLN